MPVIVHRLDSVVLADNPLKDPATRNLHVYVPPGYERDARAYPVLLALSGFKGTGGMLFNLDPFSESLDRRLDRLISEKRCGPCIVVAPDCFTRLGGNQYLNSSATGRYQDYLVQEVVPFVNRAYRTARWGAFGKSSGGYGAAMLGMHHPELFRAVADHSGDAGFELCYLPSLSCALDAYCAAGGLAPWLEAFWRDDNKHRERHGQPLEMLAMAAHYSPNPAAPPLGIDFPVDVETGAFRPEVWERWRAWDPVNRAAPHAAALKRLALLYLDCGTRDEFGLLWGARAFSAKLRALGVEHRYAEFDDGHMNIPYRYDVSLPLLVSALEGEA